MIAAAAAALVLAAFVGASLARMLWAPSERRAGTATLIVFLGLGIGLAVSGQLYFLATAWFPGERGIVSVAADIVLGLAALVVAVARGGDVAPVGRREGGVPPLASSEEAAGRRFHAAAPLWTLLFASVFAQMAVVALVVAARGVRAGPYGAWDGWAIWNMHARFLWRAPQAWDGLLRQPSLAWSHPDYPLAVPAAVARLWTWIGSDAGWASGAVSLLFAAGTVGLLAAAAARVRGPAIGFLMGIILLGTPTFLVAAASEQADVPLGFFLLAASVLLVLAEADAADARGLGALCGLTAGLAAGVKNEGWLVVLVISAVWTMRSISRRRGGAGFWLGLGCGALPALYFKWRFAARNDLVASQPWRRLHLLFDAERVQAVLAALRSNLMPAALVLALLVVWVLCSNAGWSAGSPSARGGTQADPHPDDALHPAPAGIVVGAMLAGYCLVYLLTPYDLNWHLRNSLDRLLLQLWPSTLWFAALLLPAADGAVSGKTSRRPTWAIANGAVAVGIILLLSRQRAANEFAFRWIDGDRVSAALQQGWLGPEADRRDRWSWTSGDGAIDIVAPRGLPAVSIGFALRSLRPRLVTVRWRGGVIWQGEVGTGYSHVNLSPLPFASGALRLQFSSREPPVLESTRPDARALAFAVYDLTLR